MKNTFINVNLSFLIITATAVLSSTELETGNKSACYSNNSENKSETRNLSRRKRFLVFPDSSSLQMGLVYQLLCIAPVGDILQYGGALSLAWELPTDPTILNMFKEHKKDYRGNRRNDVSKLIYYLDEAGKVISRVPYHRRPIVNPAFVKRSLRNSKANNLGFTIKGMHEKHKHMHYVKGLLENSDFHREGRRSFYVKLEKFFQGLGWNGKECVLKILCETGKTEKKQGTFVEEIIKATFTLPKGRAFESEVDQQYDVAHRSQGDCSELYPECEDVGLAL